MNRLNIIFICLITMPFQSLAQDHEEDTDPHHDSIIHLGPIQVLGDFNGSNILTTVPTVSNLHGEELLKKTKNSLGETLKDEVGVNSTQFGPAASRPVIRGLEGDRIRILQNGIGLMDASGTSQDHAVASNPLSAESVEIVRGPINLLYGSSAIGGVINIVNSRIHQNHLTGFIGNFDIKTESVNSGQNYAGKFDYGTNNFVFHFDGNYTKSKNVNTPDGEILNSQLNQHSFAAGTTYFTESKNYLGLSYSNFQNDYGVVKELDANIELNQDRVDLAGYYSLTGWFKGIRLRSAQTLYKHTEFENGAAGTIFKNTGNETRIELIQNNSNNWSGIFGFQSKIFEFQASGDEAFLPTAEQSTFALFGFEEYEKGSWKLNTGLRGEFSEYQTDGIGFFSSPIEKDFNVGSAALGGLYSLNQSFSTGLNLSYSERAPNQTELFAMGAHKALGIYEQGDVNMDKESSIGLEWSLRYKDRDNTAIFTVFHQSFENFIALNPTGTFDDTDESGTAGDSSEDFEIFNFNQNRARIQGVELEWTSKIPWNLQSRFTFDYLDGKNIDTNTPLPRISPMRLGIALEYSKGLWNSALEWRNIFEQKQIAPNETSTSSYSLVNLTGSYRLKVSNESVLNIYAQINNIGDARARNHISLLKNQLLLPGRNFVAGARWIF